MTRKKTAANATPGADLLALAINSSAVIALRCQILASGGRRARDEAVLMVQEKVDEAAGLQWDFLLGRLGSNPEAICRTIVRRYARTVEANRKRLA